MAQIDSFIATLGTGTVLYAVAMWLKRRPPGGGRAAGGASSLAGADLFGLPVPAFYVAAGGAAAVGGDRVHAARRALYVIGANPKAAELNGLSVRRHVMGAFVANGLLSAGWPACCSLRGYADRPGQRRAQFLPGARRRLPRQHHHPPGRVNVWGHAGGRRDPGDRHLRHPAIRRRVLRRAAVQRLTLLISIGIAGWAQQRVATHRSAAASRSGRSTKGAPRSRPRHPAPLSRPGHRFRGTDHAASGSIRSRSRRSRPPAGPLSGPAAAVPSSTPPRPKVDDGRRQGQPGTAHQRRKAARGKTVVFVAADMKNGGIVGVSKGVEEAGKAIGWTVRVIDGQRQRQRPHRGAEPGAGAQARRHRRRRLRHHRAEGGLRQRRQGGHPAGRLEPGPEAGARRGSRPVRQRHRPPPDDISEAGALWAVADSDGKAGVVIFTDSQYSIAIYKARRWRR